MNTSAIVMMIIAMLVIWGGLVLAMLNLRRGGPELPEGSEIRRDL